MLPAPISPPQTFHTCSSPFLSQTQALFCFDCGKMISPDKTKEFYRPDKFDEPTRSGLEGSIVFKNMVEKQSRNRFFNKSSNHLDFRNNLIKYIKQLCEKLDYSSLTFHLSCAILDAVLSLFSINKAQIKMLTLVAVFLAAKMHESLDKIPELSAVSKKFADDFSVEDLIICESRVFKILDFNLNIVTPYDFACQFLYKGVLSNQDIDLYTTQQELSYLMEKLEKLIFLFVDVSIQDYHFYQFTSLSVAASSVLCARKTLGFPELWNEDLKRLCLVSYDDIKEAASFLFNSAKIIYPLLDESESNDRRGLEKTPETKKKVGEFETKSGFDGSDVKNQMKEREESFTIKEFKIMGGKMEEKENR